MDISKELIDKVKSLYEQAVSKYKESTRPANYIPGWINRRLEQKLSIEQIYCIVHNIENKPKCAVCGKDCKFINLTWGYRKTCIGTCSRKTEEYKNLMKMVHKNRPNPNKGKTYFEIYGERKVKCGFQKGENNIAKRPEIREKISIGVRKSYIINNGKLREQRRKQAQEGTFCKAHHSRRYPDINGNLYRSQLEVKFANLLISENIPFKYEVPVRMKNDKLKIVDFVIDDSLFVEISGYAYDKWKQDFDSKMKIFDQFRDVYNSIILILTYPDNLSELEQRQQDFKNNCINIFYDSINNEKHFLRGIKFYRSLLFANRYFKGAKNVYN